MSKIGKLIYNIHQYGNSKFYIMSENPNAFNTLEFLVDENGSLSINSKLEVFDRPYYNNGKIVDGAVLKKSIEVGNYSDNDLEMIINLLIKATFYDSSTFITQQEIPLKVNTNCAVNMICEKAKKLLQLSNSTLTLWVTGFRAEKLHLDYSELGETIPNTNSEISDVEKEVYNVFTRLMNVMRVWMEMNNSQSQDEYDKISKEWDALYSDKKTQKRQIMVKLLKKFR